MCPWHLLQWWQAALLPAKAACAMMPLARRFVDFDEEVFRSMEWRMFHNWIKPSA
jgi:hypothetical protein